jgi:hypothetical protein
MSLINKFKPKKGNLIMRNNISNEFKEIDQYLKEQIELIEEKERTDILGNEELTAKEKMNCLKLLHNVVIEMHQHRLDLHFVELEKDDDTKTMTNKFMKKMTKKINQRKNNETTYRN